MRARYSLTHFMNRFDLTCTHLYSTPCWRLTPISIPQVHQTCLSPHRPMRARYLHTNFMNRSDLTCTHLYSTLCWRRTPSTPPFSISSPQVHQTCLSPHRPMRARYSHTHFINRPDLPSTHLYSTPRRTPWTAAEMGTQRRNWATSAARGVS